ncbi:MAG: hypothetical protein ACM336_02985 [Acidobacteriota bacterium]
MNSISDIKAREGEFNTYAHKYGFKDYIEYIDTWGRVMVGQMIVASAPDTSTLNGQDLALIEKYDEQITAAAKAHRGI